MFNLPWVLVRRTEIARFRAELEACHEAMWEGQWKLTQERKARYLADNRIKALEAQIEVKEKK